MNEIVVSAENVSKKFSRLLKHVMYYGALDIYKGSMSIPSDSGRLREGEFWAVENISFQLSRGKTLGIIGPNGAGKSTILKMINGIFMPDTGMISVNGGVGALIEVGAGFHPLLTGRENIYIYGSILGMKKSAIDKKFDSIVAFSGIQEFLDTPVKYYSSGMYVRLGFSVAIHCDPDILLIDEILSVGDSEFREKCMRRMSDIKKSGTAIIFISHNLYNVEALCDDAILLDRGKVQNAGKARDVVTSYMNWQEKRESSRIPIAELGGPSGEPMPVIIEKVELIDARGRTKHEFAFGEGMTARISYNALRRIERPLFNLRILFKGSGTIEAGMLIDGHGPECIEGRGFVECVFDTLPLTPNIYDILIFARSGDGIVNIIRENIYARFTVTEEGTDKIPMKGPMAMNHLKTGAAVYVPRRWNWKR